MSTIQHYGWKCECHEDRVYRYDQCERDSKAQLYDIGYYRFFVADQIIHPRFMVIELNSSDYQYCIDQPCRDSAKCDHTCPSQHMKARARHRAGDRWSKDAEQPAGTPICQTNRCITKDATIENQARLTPQFIRTKWHGGHQCVGRWQCDSYGEIPDWLKISYNCTVNFSNISGRLYCKDATADQSCKY